VDSAALQLLNNRCLLIVFSFFFSYRFFSAFTHNNNRLVWLPKYFSILYKKKADCAQQ